MPAGVHRLWIPAENSHTESDGSINRKEVPVTSISNLSNWKLLPMLQLNTSVIDQDESEQSVLYATIFLEL